MTYLNIYLYNEELNRKFLLNTYTNITDFYSIISRNINLESSEYIELTLPILHQITRNCEVQLRQVQMEISCYEKGSDEESINTLIEKQYTYTGLIATASQLYFLEEILSDKDTDFNKIYIGLA